MRRYGRHGERSPLSLSLSLSLFLFPNFRRPPIRREISGIALVDDDDELFEICRRSFAGIFLSRILPLCPFRGMNFKRSIPRRDFARTSTRALTWRTRARESSLLSRGNKIMDEFPVAPSASSTKLFGEVAVGAFVFRD